jgi:hypothetical protein
MENSKNVFLIRSSTVYCSMKRANIVDEEDDSFSLEYDTTIGTRNVMRLEAATYEGAVREAKAFLGIAENCDEAGDVWEIN